MDKKDQGIKSFFFSFRNLNEDVWTTEQLIWLSGDA